MFISGRVFIIAFVAGSLARRLACRCGRHCEVLSSSLGALCCVALGGLPAQPITIVRTLGCRLLGFEPTSVDGFDSWPSGGPSRVEVELAETLAGKLHPGPCTKQLECVRDLAAGFPRKPRSSFTLHAVIIRCASGA